MSKDVVMEVRDISQDDIQDVMEMTQKIERYINNTLKDTDLNISFSVLLSSFINVFLPQCDSLYEAQHYRSVFVKVIDKSINSCGLPE